MKKMIIALAAALATAFGASATDYAYTLVLNKTDGQHVKYLFENTPVATIEGDEVTILETATKQQVTYPIADILNFTFEYVDNGVEGVISNPGDVAFGLTADTLEAYGLPSGTEVAIFDMAGNLRVTGVSAVDGSASLGIAGLEKGVYIVKAGKHTFKFIR